MRNNIRDLLLHFKKTLPIVLLSLSLLLSFVSTFGLRSLHNLENSIKKRVYNFLSENNIEITLKDKKFISFRDYSFSTLQIKFKNAEITLYFDDIFCSIRNTGLKLNTGKLYADFFDNHIETNGDENNLSFDISWSGEAGNINFDVKDIYIKTSEDFEVYVSKIKSENAKKFFIQSINLIETKGGVQNRVQSDYIAVQLNKLNILRKEIDADISFEYLPLKFSGLGVDIYNTNLKIYNSPKGVKASIITSSFDVKKSNNNILTFDNVKLDLEKSLSPDRNYNINFASNILDAQGTLYTNEKRVQASAKLNIIENFEISADFDFSDYRSMRANLLFNSDIKIPFIDETLKGNAFVRLENNRILFAGDGFKILDFKLVPYADFYLNDKNKQLYINLLYDNKNFCMLKFDLSEDKKEFATLNFQNYSYPVKLKGERRKINLSISDNFDVKIDYFNKIKVLCDINDFVFLLPFEKNGKFTNAKLNLSAQLEADKNSVNISPSSFSIFYPEFSFSTDFSLKDNFLIFDNSELRSNNSSWRAFASILIPKDKKVQNLTGQISAMQTNGNGNFIFSASKNNVDTDFLLKINGISASFFNRFGISDVDVNVNLRTDFKNIKFISGAVKIKDLKSKDILSGQISYDDKKIVLNSANFEYNGIKFNELNLNFDSSDMTFNLATVLSTGYYKFDGKMPVSSSIAISGKLSANGDENISLSKIIKNKDNLAFSGIFKLNDIKLGDLKFQGAECDAKFEDSKLFLGGNELQMMLDMKEKSLTLDLLSPLLPVNAHISGSNKNGALIASVDLKRISNSFLNALIVNPLIGVEESDIQGWLDIKIENNTPDIQCSLHTGQIVLNLFWLENEWICANDFEIIGMGRKINVISAPCVAMNKRTGNVANFDFSASIDFMPNDLIPYWRFDVTVPDNCFAQANLPLLPADFNVDIGKVNGKVGMSAHGMNNMLLFGNLFVDDVSFSTPARVPEWLSPKKSAENGVDLSQVFGPVDVDMNLRTGKNVQFVYPNPQNALLDVLLKENQTGHFKYVDKDKEFHVDNVVEIERGEIFYFNKKFIIEEGNFTWPERKKEDYLSLKKSEMSINLLASLRDFDNKGNVVDLYMRIENANMGNIKPKFSASNVMDESEIMYRFGQSIFNTEMTNSTSEGGYLNSASLIFDAALVVNSLRGGGVFSFGGNFAKNLGVDIWTFRTQILSTFFAEGSLSMFNRSYRLSENVFSRFINGTSFNVAKKIGKEFILSLQMEFNSTIDPLIKDKGVEVMPNLYCSTVLSLEWVNKIARTTFLFKPNDFSLPGFISGFGINVVKTLNF